MKTDKQTEIRAGTEAWKKLALALADEAELVLDNSHWEVSYGSGDLRRTVKAVRKLQKEETIPTNNKTSQRKSGLCPALGSAIGPFEVYEDYENGLQIIDGHTRVMLSDSYAYDETEDARTERMEWIAEALTDASKRVARKPNDK